MKQWKREMLVILEVRGDSIFQSDGRWRRPSQGAARVATQFLCKEEKGAWRPFLASKGGASNRANGLTSQSYERGRGPISLRRATSCSIDLQGGFLVRLIAQPSSKDHAPQVLDNVFFFLSRMHLIVIIWDVFLFNWNIDLKEWFLEVIKVILTLIT